jgi:hypothetical protein
MATCLHVERVRSGRARNPPRPKSSGEIAEYSISEPTRKNLLTTSSPARPSVRWTTPHITVGATLPRDQRWNRCDAPCAICERRDLSTPPSTLGASTTNNRARNRTPASAADRINLALSTLPAEPPPRPASAALPGTRQKRPEDERGSATGLWDRSSRDREPASRSWRRREAVSPSMIVAATGSRWPRNAHASVLGRHISITASPG